MRWNSIVFSLSDPKEPELIGYIVQDDGERLSRDMGSKAAGIGAG